MIFIALLAVGLGFLGAWSITSALNPAEADVADNSSPSPSPHIAIKVLKPTPSETPLPAGQERVTIGVFGVRLIATDPIGDLVYGAVGTNSYRTAGFTTEAFIAQYPLCKPGVLGSLSRKLHVGSTRSPSPSPTRSPSGTPKPTASPQALGPNGFIKTVGNFDYYYVQPSGAGIYCATDQAGRNALAAAKSALINAVLPSLSQ
jgi:hypothetical protein